MAIIEFSNLETENAFMAAMLKEREDFTRQELEQEKLKRILYLVKRGHWSPDLI